MEPNWQLISEILITLRINNNRYMVNPCNFPHYDCQELLTHLSFLTEIGLVNTNELSYNGDDCISHRLTFEGKQVTEKLMDGFYENLT